MDINNIPQEERLKLDKTIIRLFKEFRIDVYRLEQDKEMFLIRVKDVIDEVLGDSPYDKAMKIELKKELGLE